MKKPTRRLACGLLLLPVLLGGCLSLPEIPMPTEVPGWLLSPWGDPERPSEPPDDRVEEEEA